MRLAIAAALGTALLAPIGAQEPGITKQQADQILNELRQIRQLLESQAKRGPEEEPPAQKAQLKLAGGYMLGSPDAPVTMVEFTDYQCPFCQRFHVSTFYELKKNFIDTGKVRFYSRDLPLDFHPNAFRAAEAARCAGDQGQFWRMRDLLASNPSKLAPEHIAGYAAEIKLDAAAFKKCIDSGKHKAAIEADLKEAQALGINGTPAFVIGKSTKEGVDGEIVIGAQPYPAFEAKLKEFAPR